MRAADSNSDNIEWVAYIAKAGGYVYTKDVIVKNVIFARRFSNRRQANSYLRRNGFSLEDCIVNEFNASVYTKDLIMRVVQDRLESSPLRLPKAPKNRGRKWHKVS